MNWQEAMQRSQTEAIHRDPYTCITGPSESVPQYDVLVNEKTLICGIPSPEGVCRVLQEFEIPQQGWR